VIKARLEMKSHVDITRSAEISDCKKYRYALWRHWGAGKSYAMFIGLNPSIADEKIDDPTIRRCMAFAKDWGYDGLCMANLFAYRATLPEKMKRSKDPIGPDTNKWLNKLAKKADIVVAAWGVHGQFMQRGQEVQQMIQPLQYLRLTKRGYPGHPLYLPKTLVPQPWIEE
jgi:hypothetical protein